MLWKADEREPPVEVKPADLVKTFLALCPEHRYARLKLLRYANPGGGNLGGDSLNTKKWQSVSALTTRSK